MKKPKPKSLGTGMAAKAGKHLKNRKSKIDAAMDKAMGKGKPTKAVRTTKKGKPTRARG